MELKSVIHYYIGQQCKVISVSGNISAFLAKPEEIVGISYVTLACVYDSVMVVKPILRKIDSLTDEELAKSFDLVFPDDYHVSIYAKAQHFKHRITGNMRQFEPITFHYLLSIGIDLFGLIDNNHAIDKETL